MTLELRHVLNVSAALAVASFISCCVASGVREMTSPVAFKSKERWGVGRTREHGELLRRSRAYRVVDVKPLGRLRLDKLAIDEQLRRAGPPRGLRDAPRMQPDTCGARTERRDETEKRQEISSALWPTPLSASPSGSWRLPQTRPPALLTTAPTGAVATLRTARRRSGSMLAAARKSERPFQRLFFGFYCAVP